MTTPTPPDDAEVKKLVDHFSTMLDPWTAEDAAQLMADFGDPACDPEVCARLAEFLSEAGILRPLTKPPRHLVRVK